MTSADEKMALYRAAKADPRTNAHELARLWDEVCEAFEREKESKAKLANQEDEQ